MKQLNYEQVKDEARRYGISPFLHIKRKIKYRLDEKPFKKSCLNCEYRFKITFRLSDERNQCQIIGADISKSADVGFDNTCEYFSSLYKD